MLYRGRELDPVAVAWAAGFLDGEGCFTISRTSNPRQLTPRVTAAQIVRTPLDRLVDLFNGSVSTRPPPKGNRRQEWRWELCGATAMTHALPLLIPHLIVKHDQAVLMLEYAKRIDPRTVDVGKRSATAR